MARQRAVRPAPMLDVHGVDWRVVLTMLQWKWSPQQIAATLKRTFPNKPARHGPSEPIYTAIFALPRGEPRRQIIACLRQGHGTRLLRFQGLPAISRKLRFNEASASIRRERRTFSQAWSRSSAALDAASMRRTSAGCGPPVPVRVRTMFAGESVALKVASSNGSTVCANWYLVPASA